MADPAWTRKFVNHREVGFAVGELLGEEVGLADGLAVGELLGEEVGLADGFAVG
jgi:hypothetical protein